VLVVAGKAGQDAVDASMTAAMRLFSLLRTDLSLKRAVAIAAEFCGVRKNELYERALAAEGQGKSSASD
jgi:16S rRNA C1402 (ribose-2'-O) methylase RsmI